jgi:hypothetical protein
MLQSWHCTKHTHDSIVAGLNALLQIQVILQSSDRQFTVSICDGSCAAAAAAAAVLLLLMAEIVHLLSSPDDVGLRSCAPC